MTMREARRITAIWARIEIAEPDLSDEQLAARAADEAGVDHCDVYEALAKTEDEECRDHA